MAHGMGHKPTLEILARIGRGLTEHSYEGGQTTRGFGAGTPAAAKEQISILRWDREFTSRLVSGDAKAQGEWTRLHETAYPEGQGGG